MLGTYLNDLLAVAKRKGLLKEFGSTVGSLELISAVAP